MQNLFRPQKDTKRKSSVQSTRYFDSQHKRSKINLDILSLFLGFEEEEETHNITSRSTALLSEQPTVSTAP